jgi:hypothetical protein
MATTLSVARQAPAPPRRVAPRRRGVAALVGLVVLAGLVQAFAVGLVLHRLHRGGENHEVVYISPALHWLRDSALAAPPAVTLLLAVTLVARRIATRGGRPGDSIGAHLLWVGLGSLSYAAASVPAAEVHERLFDAHHGEGSFLLHSALEAVVTLRWSLVVLLGFAVVFGVPWAGRPDRRRARHSWGEDGSC